tara:strand:- start:1015 stop:1479 length:465 start_codon:yes stop_codon:yes gene_type:complete
VNYFRAMTNEPFGSLYFQLDSNGTESLTKLGRWSKVLGSINIVIGVSNLMFSLPYFLPDNDMNLFAIPTIGVAALLIYLGLQLTGSASHLRFALLNESDREFAAALNSIRKFLFISSLVYLGSLTIILTLVIIGSVLGIGFEELLKNETGPISI